MRLTNDSRIKIAVQKSGRLTDHSLELLVRCGLSYSRGKDQLICYGENMPVDVLLVTTTTSRASSRKTFATSASWGSTSSKNDASS